MVLHIFKNRGFSSKINCLWFTIRVKIASFSLLGRVQSDGRMSLALRFPENLWLEAKQYFSSADDWSHTNMDRCHCTTLVYLLLLYGDVTVARWYTCHFTVDRCHCSTLAYLPLYHAQVSLVALYYTGYFTTDICHFSNLVYLSQHHGQMSLYYLGVLVTLQWAYVTMLLASQLDLIPAIAFTWSFAYIYYLGIPLFFNFIRFLQQSTEQNKNIFHDL